MYVTACFHCRFLKDFLKFIFRGERNIDVRETPRFKCVTFKLTSCRAAWLLIGPDRYWSAAWRLGTPGVKNPKLNPESEH